LSSFIDYLIATENFIFTELIPNLVVSKINLGLV